MRTIHHLDCGTMRPPGRRFVNGSGGWLGRGKFVCHCLLIETKEGLVLVDSGFGLDDVADPVRRLGRLFVSAFAPRLDREQTAAVQVERLGYRREDVRHVITTHLDLDHAGGLADFPHATVHVLGDEHRAAMNRHDLNAKQRYCPAHWAHGPSWKLHEADGERFEGFACARAIVEPEVLLVPTVGHTRGHAVIAIDTAEEGASRWLLHCGDAYFHHGEMEDPPSAPPGPAIFQRMMSVDDRARRDNQRRLRELARRPDRFTLFSAHDPEELARFAQPREP